MASMDSSTRKAIGELDGLIDTRAALLSWEESLAAPYDGREVWVHSDLKPNNLLVSAEGRVTAVIDFETCGVGDPACDLFPVWYLLPANGRDEFRAALDVDDATWLRGRGACCPRPWAICGTTRTPNRRSRTTRGTPSARCSQLPGELYCPPRPGNLSLVISSVPEISHVLEVVEDLLLLGADGRREGLDRAVDRDGSPSAAGGANYASNQPQVPTSFQVSCLRSC